jgi:predicted HicB family RNase H-like nuclease
MKQPKLFNMRVKPVLFERLRNRADKEGRSLSEITRQALLEYLDKKDNEDNKKM